MFFRRVKRNAGAIYIYTTTLYHYVSPMTPELSIVIPAFDEEDRVGDSINRILAFLRDKSLAAELILVDDGSRDRTSE